MARAPKNAECTFVRELGGIREYRLEHNGLRILLAEDHSAPVAGCMVTYHVGSRNEATGYTGATHLLEHLLFKGSKRFNPVKGNALDKIIEAKGGMVNATTWLDRTNYFEIVPKDALPLAIEAEADRMRTALFTEEDRAGEMPIVRNEFERGENLSSEALDKELWAAAFMAHPYHHSTIGWRSDIENVPIERLRTFYNDFYWPDNATVTIAGSFNEQEVLELIVREFGKHSKKADAYPQLYTTEPPQQGERRVTVKRAGTPMVALAHKIPEATHEDIPALVLLSSILDDGKTSKLYRAFIDTGLATDVSAYAWQFHDPSLFQSFITLAPKTTHEKAERTLREVYAAIISSGVTNVELTRAKRSYRAYIAGKRDGVYALLMAINEDIARGDWTRFVTFDEKVQQVTAADVRRVARTYFVDTGCVTGWFLNTSV